MHQQSLQQLAQPSYAHRPVYQQQPQPSPTLEALLRDIDNLIYRFKTAFANNYDDAENRTKLQALLQLQIILKSQSLQPHELEAIRVQLAQLSLGPPSAPAPNSYALPPTTPAAPYPAVQSPPAYVPLSTPTHYSPPPAAPVAPPPVQQPQPDLSSLLNSNALASLLASVQAQKPAPTPPVAQTPIPPPQPQYSQAPSTPTPPATTQPSSLIASLRAAGYLPAESTPPMNGSAASALAPVYPSTQAPQTPQFSAAAPTTLPTSGPMNDVELTSASLKM